MTPRTSMVNAGSRGPSLASIPVELQLKILAYCLVFDKIVPETIFSKLSFPGRDIETVFNILGENGSSATQLGLLALVVFYSRNRFEVSSGLPAFLNVRSEKRIANYCQLQDHVRHLVINLKFESTVMSRYHMDLDDLEGLLECPKLRTVKASMRGPRGLYQDYEAELRIVRLWGLFQTLKIRLGDGFRISFDAWQNGSLLDLGENISWMSIRGWRNLTC